MRESGPMPVALSFCLSLMSVVLQLPQVHTFTDVHGGVPMGLSNACDDAENNIEIDWDPKSTMENTCYGEAISPSEINSNVTCERYTKQPTHVCYPDRIFYGDVPPTSGKHRPNWPDYGEYRYVPPQRWLHNLEHGAIVMLYHPCADPVQVSMLREIVTHCLRKHIITPYRLLAAERPFALLSWGCKLIMGRVDPQVARQFIKDHAKRDGPEGQVSKAGKYTKARLVEARVVSDFDDSVICPNHLDSAEDATTPGTNKDQQIHYIPAWTLENRILIQSQKRQQRLNEETEKLRHSVRRLFQSYRRLVLI